MEFENHKFAAFIADYITEEIIRGNTHIDRWMILDAIEAYKGGAAEGEAMRKQCRTCGAFYYNSGFDLYGGCHNGCPGAPQKPCRSCGGRG